MGSDMDDTQETVGGATTAALLSMEVDDLFGDLLAPPAIDLDTAVPSIPVPPPPPPDVLGNGRVLRCPFCPRYSTEGQARHLIRHMNCKHAGAKIEPHARTLLDALERGICCNSNCKSVRPLVSSSCTYCRQCVAVRRLVEGDAIPVRAVLREVESPAISVSRTLPEASLPDGELPVDFAARVALLPSMSIMRVPVKLRGRLAATTVATLTGLARGVEKASVLEQARTKLLLGPVPKFRNKRTELVNRFDAWDAGHFELLLIRAEEQNHQRKEARKKSLLDGDNSRSKARRAKDLAQNGAYSKAVSSLTSELASFTPAEEVAWSEQLLPRSGRPDEVLAEAVVVDLASDTTPPRDAMRQVLKGVHFKASSAPGPSGCRPEHLQDALSSRPRSSASRLLVALNELYSKAVAGELAPHCRWLLGSRLIFLRKKSGKPRPIRIGEFWRRFIGKKLVSGTATNMRPTFAKARQYGVGIPGGCEGLIHFRLALEESLKRDPGTPLVILDLDLKNAFPSFE